MDIYSVILMTLITMITSTMTTTITQIINKIVEYISTLDLSFKKKYIGTLIRTEYFDNGNLFYDLIDYDKIDMENTIIQYVSENSDENVKEYDIGINQYKSKISDNLTKYEENKIKNQ